jgi:tetratricopeptide (TPR) repeat protein
MRTLAAWVIGVALAVASAKAVAAQGAALAAQESASDLASKAMRECEAGRELKSRDDRKARFEAGQAIAERAVALDDNSAAAHFSLFCNMGELMRVDGESLRSVFALRRMMAELDRTLELDPGHVDAMASKGTLLIRLPRILGGDAEKGEAMLRDVIRLDPSAFNSRLTLARACNARGDHEEAVAFATRALQIAKEQGKPDKVAEAQTCLAELHSAR